MTEILAQFNHAWHTHILSAYRSKERLHDAIHYILNGDGKRVRAQCAMMTATAFGKDSRIALSGACAVEIIHAYSLVHDDLPCMDDDDWRRGRLSAHRAFDEATALLAGDALLTDAFRVLADPDFFPDAALVHPEDRTRQVTILAKAAGGHGMVAGQARDLWWTARSGATLADLNQVHRAKTGALLGASCAVGAAAAGASRAEISAMEEFGKLIGTAFQAIDDVLDTSQTTGKSMGKDESQQKLTYLKFYSVDETKDLAKCLTRKALELLPTKNTEDLRVFTEALVFRNR